MPGPSRIVLAVLTVLASLAATVSWAPRAHAEPVVRWEHRVSDRILDIGVSSPHLEGPELSVKVVRLLLPPGWSPDADRTWPTIWVLHGGMDDHTSWTDKGGLEALTAGREAIFVLPETSWCSAYSDWWNYGAYGAPAWERYLLDDVRPLLETRYRAGTTRAIAGNSMGGLGAMKFAAEHRDLFLAAAAFSGNVDPLRESGAPGGPDLPGLGCAADWKRVWGDHAVPEQRAIWRENNPYSRAADLTGIPLFVSYGRGDPVEVPVYEQNLRFVARLRALGADVEERYGPTDGHNWAAWQVRMSQALPMLLAAVGA
ncbi:prolyl oligopeptidase family serine peptidase [Nocardia higoensis]|uniref:Prolyl oligopeptidase family serine peptidase n=1 Tax=Nocardia higoensis TaxID=228599 RepID=A0ABS0DGL0_9NOCA|nr:alpha/beta hydrolase family protein [Nocardia higoensis]MBF6357612.1 prolyl oligopeptidase family serine peptidase [Nocardia higoensis]